MSRTYTQICSLVVMVFLGAGLKGSASPFSVRSSGSLSNHFTLAWDEWSALDGEGVPNGSGFTASDGGGDVWVSGVASSVLRIENSAESEMSGVLLESVGSGGILLAFGRAVQGVGLRVDSALDAAAEYAVDFYDGAGVLLFSVDESTSGEPVFLGAVDPEGRIEQMVVTASPGSRFWITEPQVQLVVVPESNPLAMPVASQQVVRVDPRDTYLHQGLGVRLVDQATQTASRTHTNVFDLSKLFPALRAGDLLRLQRKGFVQGADGQTVPLVGVLSRTEELSSGGAFHRVPGAVPAGRPVFTGSVRGRTLRSATNIQEDFIIGSDSLITVPADTPFLMTSLATPSAASNPLGLVMSHIPRRVFAEWAAGLGLYGPWRELDSDLDGDGLTLVEEFVFQKDPTEQDADTIDDYSFSPRIRLGANGGPMTLLFGGVLSGPFRISAEFSSDLKTWEPVSSEAIGVYLSDRTTGRALLGATDLNSGPVRFGRLLFEYIAPPLN